MLSQLSLVYQIIINETSVLLKSSDYLIAVITVDYHRCYPHRCNPHDGVIAMGSIYGDYTAYFLKYDGF